MSTPTIQSSDAPYTLSFTEWRCGHHGTRPADIPVSSIEQAQLILQAIGFAISQPGHASAAIFDDTRGTNVYITDDYATVIPKDWPYRTIIFHGNQAEIDELLSLQTAWEETYGSTLKQWDGKTWLDDLEVITTLDLPAIEAAIRPVDWHEDGHRHAVCVVPPVLKPASELLEELRTVAADLAAEGGAA